MRQHKVFIFNTISDWLLSNLISWFVFQRRLIIRKTYEVIYRRQLILNHIRYLVLYVDSSKLYSNVHNLSLFNVPLIAKDWCDSWKCDDCVCKVALNQLLVLKFDNILNQFDKLILFSLNPDYFIFTFDLCKAYSWVGFFSLCIYIYI